MGFEGDCKACDECSRILEMNFEIRNGAIA